MKRDYSKLTGMLLVVASLVCIVILFIIDINVIFEPPYLLPITNTIFTAIIPVVIAFFAAKTYLKSGSLSIFLMGCGMLSFGISAALAGWLRPAQNGANINVTIYNTGALIGALFHIVGAVLSSFGKSHWECERGKLIVASSYCGVFAFIILFTFATFERIIPPFFIQGYGPTALRQVVLGLAIFFYLLSAIFFMDNYLKVKSDFFYWYSLGLTMLAFGLFAFYIQKGVGSPIGWAGRTTNYIGSIFTLVAILIAIRSSKAKGLALEDVISSFFMDAEANFRSLVEKATDAIISYDQEGRIILWNSGAERIFDYTKQEAVGAPFYKLLVPEEYSAAVEKLITSAKSSTASEMDFPSTAEIEVKKKDGRRVAAEISAFVRKLPMGWVSTYIVRDISERKQAHEALEKMKNILSEGQKIAHVGTFEYIADTQTTVWSEEEYRIYGLDPTGPSPAYDVMLAKSIHPNDATLLHQTFTAAMQSNSIYELEHRIVHPDGSVRWVYDRAHPYFDEKGNLVRYVGATLDITERKRAEENLRKSEEKYLKTFQSNPAGVGLSRMRDGLIVEANEAMLKLLGYNDDEFIGHTILELGVWNDLADRERMVQTAIANGKTLNQEYWLRKKTGELLLSNHSAELIQIDNEPHIIFTFFDITERKKMEQALAEHAAMLEEANKELESFSYSVSHDLRAPLRAIDGYTRLILKKQGDKFDEDTLRRFKDIRLNAQMMGKLIDDLLTFSRLSRKDMSRSEMNMVDLIREEWKVLININPDRNINLIVSSMPLGYGDATLIKQVYHNLLSNAVKFTRSRDYAQIEVGGYNDGNETVFYVKDNGVGFDMKFCDKLFGVFQRLHNDHDYEGTGVGLATVQRIVHRQGGRVWAEGKVNEGATFYFTLPRKAA